MCLMCPSIQMSRISRSDKGTLASSLSYLRDQGTIESLHPSRWLLGWFPEREQGCDTKRRSSWCLDRHINEILNYQQLVVGMIGKIGTEFHLAYAGVPLLIYERTPFPP